MDEGSRYPGHRWLVLFSVSFSVISATIAMTAFAPILSEIGTDLKVPIDLATNLMMGYVLANAFFLFFGGAVCDRYGITLSMVLGLLCCALPASIMPWAGHEFKTVFIFRLIQGASMGFVFATMGPVLALWFPLTEQGIASGLMIGAMSVGSAAGVSAAPSIFSALGNWQLTMAFLSIPAWFGIVLAILVTRRKPPAILSADQAMSLSPGNPGMSYTQALFQPFTWVGCGIVFCNAWGLYGLYNMVPAYLSEKVPVGLGLGPLLAGKLSLSVTIIGFFAMIAGGLFFDKAAKGNYRIAMIIGFILTGISTYLILTPAVHNQQFLLVIFLLLAGWGIPFMNASISAAIVGNYPMQMVGRMVGLWFGFGTFGGAIGIYLGGVSIAKSGSFYWAIIAIAIAAFAGIALSWLSRFTKMAHEPHPHSLQ
jgi:MFS family permease